MNITKTILQLIVTGYVAISLSCVCIDYQNNIVSFDKPGNSEIVLPSKQATQLVLVSPLDQTIYVTDAKGHIITESKISKGYRFVGLDSKNDYMLESTSYSTNRELYRKNGDQLESILSGYESVISYVRGNYMATFESREKLRIRDSGKTILTISESPWWLTFITIDPDDNLLFTVTYDDAEKKSKIRTHDLHKRQPIFNPYIKTRKGKFVECSEWDASLDYLNKNEVICFCSLSAFSDSEKAKAKLIDIRLQQPQVSRIDNAYDWGLVKINVKTGIADLLAVLRYFEVGGDLSGAPHYQNSIAVLPGKQSIYLLLMDRVYSIRIP